MGHYFWQTRWFVLKRKDGLGNGRGNMDVFIEYFKTRKSAEKGDPPLGKVFCTYLRKVAFHHKGKILKPGKFRLELDGDHVFHLQAERHEEAEDWVAKLKTVVQLGERDALPQTITTVKYWKKEHLDVAVQGHTQRKKRLSMSRALGVDQLAGIQRPDSSFGSDSKLGSSSSGQTGAAGGEEEPPPPPPPRPKPSASAAAPGRASKAQPALPAPSAGLVAPQGSGGGRGRRRLGDKMKQKMARADEQRKKREAQAKNESENVAQRNELALQRLKTICDEEKRDQAAFEMRFRRVKRQQPPKPAAGFSLQITDVTGNTVAGAATAAAPETKRKKRGVTFAVPDEPVIEIKRPELKDCEGKEMEAQVKVIKDYLKKKFNLTDYHVSHLHNKIVDLHDYGRSRMLTEFKDMEAELKSRKWDLLGSIGKGGFGAVYKGRWRGKRLAGMKKKIIAIKLIDLEGEQEDMDVVHREIEALRQSQFCDQLTKLYDSAIMGTMLWIAMEFVDGGSIQSIIKKKPLDEKQIALVCKEVIKGLNFLLKDGGKIHRDIKGANILVSSDGRVKLADFGASRTLTMTCANKAATYIGTPYWMAPEIVKGDKYDGKVDVWSLGCTCIEMATQHPPFYRFKGDTAAFKVLESPAPKLPPGFSREFNEFVNKCLTKDPILRAGLEQLSQLDFIKNAPGPEALANLDKR